MVVQRSPPPVRLSPLLPDTFITNTSFTSNTSVSNRSKRIGRLPVLSSAPVPSTPLSQSIYPPIPNGSARKQPMDDVADEFPSLDAMAQAGREERERNALSSSTGSNGRGYTYSVSSSRPVPSSSTSIQVPSSLPRLNKTINSLQDNSRPVTRRSSLTAMEAARQRAGSETPTAISFAKAQHAQQQIGCGTLSDAIDLSIDDDEGDATAELIAGPGGGTIMNMSIDVEGGKVQTLVSSTSSQTRAAVSHVSNAGHSGSRRGRASEERPISSGYDFSKYLEADLDPFNTKNRQQMRRESRPLAAPISDDDEGENSGDVTFRETELYHSQPEAKSTPKQSIASKLCMSQKDKPPAVGSMPPPSQLPRAVKPVIPQLTPTSTPQLGSRKLSHLSVFGGGDDSGMLNSAQKHRLDPSNRSDRLMSLELADLRKKHAGLMNDFKGLKQRLEEVEVSRMALKEESDGWASECASLEQTNADLKAQHAKKNEQLRKVNTDTEFKLTHYKLDSDERQWRLFAQKKVNNDLEADLLYCKNEATYQTHRAYETEADLELQKDDLRVRLLIERKRSDMLLERLKANMKQGLHLRKKSNSDTEAALRSENERLVTELKEAKAEAADLRKQLRASAKSGEVEQLKQQMEELQDAKAEREEMMAETRKNWKQERKEMQAKIKELEAEAKRTPKTRKESSPVSDDQDISAAEDMTPPPSPPPVKKTTKKAASSVPSFLLEAKRRKPMQGASDAGPSEADLPASPRPSKKAAAVPSLLGRSAAATKKKSAWRDDSPEPAPPKKKAAMPKAARKAKATVPDYQDILADPSATPMIRSKRSVVEAEEEEEEAEDSFKRPAVPASRTLGKDKTNIVAAAQPKKKRKLLLGGGKGLNWGGDENAALQPDYNIPLELSPVKQMGNRRGGGILSSLGGRGPFG